MPRKVVPLTDTQIKKAKPLADKEYRLSDGDGLHLRIRKNGTKSWIFRYKRPFTENRTDMSFGKYPTVSLADARQQREAARKLLVTDIDPQEKNASDTLNKKLEKSNTFHSMMRDWLVVKTSKVSADHATDIERSLNSHVMSELGNRPVTELTNREVIDTLKPLAASGKLEMVKRVCQRINEIMIYCVNTGMLDHNSFAGINSAFASPKEQNLPTIKPDELPALMQNINRANIKIVTRCLLEWQLHTMVRPSEAAAASWSEIDLERDLWVIPGERMKVKTNGDHLVPLTPQTHYLLKFIEPITRHREFIFPADRNPKNHTNPQTANAALKRMGYHKKLVAHGLRSLASTILNEQGFDSDVIEACLAHIDSNSVRKAYNRTDYLERRRKIMLWWSQHIEDAASGSISLSSSNKNLTLIKRA